MRRKDILLKGLVVLMAIATVFLVVPSAAIADVLPYCTFFGPVTLNGQNVPAGSTVNAWIDGANGSWTGQVVVVGGESQYSVNVQPNTGGVNKNGGENGDVVHFTINIGGSISGDSSTSTWQRAKNIYHHIAATGVIPPNPPVITTTGLPAGIQGTAYNFDMTATGGTSAYTWTATGLPANLLISVAGKISGVPINAGDFEVIITVNDGVATDTNTYSLHINPTGVITITTTELTRWGVEVFPVVPPINWLPLPPPGWIINQPYTTTLTATGGTGALTWSSNNLPTGLVISAAGVVTGTPTVDGLYNIVFDVHDAAVPQNTAQTTLSLKIYVKGDANGNGSVTIGDVTYVERAILGLAAPTAGCDANLSLTTSIADVTKVERIILGLP